MYTVTEIEDALLETLEADKTLSGYVKTFTILPALDEDTLSRLILQFPAVGVVSTSGNYSYMTSNVQQETGDFSLICFNRNLRSPLSSVTGAEGEYGVWDMIDHCRAAILPGSIGTEALNVMDCLAKRRVLLFAGAKWAAAALEIEVKWRSI